MRIYKEKNEEKLQHIPKWIKERSGNAAELHSLYEKICEKYGVEKTIPTPEVSQRQRHDKRSSPPPMTNPTSSEKGRPQAASSGEVGFPAQTQPPKYKAAEEST